ncbi:MAG: alcohol dehydrogenase catalytic domain-containing protein [Woeseia sp.]
MKAAVLTGDGASTLEDLPETSPGPGGVVLRLEGCGVCASNLPVWQGRSWFQYPQQAGAPGHEPWGRIIECGDGVKGLEVGTRVTGLSYRAYAECDIARADQLVPLPARFDGRPFPGEALACAMNVFDRAGIKRGLRTAIVGAGFIGSVLIQTAAAAGAAVTAFSRRQWSLDQALDQGAVEAKPIGDALAGKENQSWPCVIECSGTQAGLDAATQLVGVRGRLVVAGYHQEGPCTVDMQQWNWKGIDVINAHERDPARYTNGIRAAMDAIDHKRLDPWPLFTHSLPLQDIDRAFRLMQERPEGFTKATLCL